MTITQFRKLALSFPGAEEMPHFEKPSFRVKKKIFAVLDEKKEMATLKLSELDQSVFCSYSKKVIYPVPNKWGKQGWTFVELKETPKDLIKDALQTAYNEVAKPNKK